MNGKVVNSIILVLLLLMFSLSGSAQAKPKRDVLKDQKPQAAMAKKSPQKQKTSQKRAVETPLKSTKIAKRNTGKTINKNLRYTPRRATYIYVDGQKNISTIVGYGNSRVDYAVDTDGRDWKFTHIPSWCSLIKTSPTGFMLYTLENLSYEERNDFFYVESDDEFVKIAVTQQEKPVDVNRIDAEYSCVSLYHNSISYMQSIEITANLYIRYAKGVELVPVAFIEDNNGNSIKASASWSSYARPSSGDVYVTGTPIKPTSYSGQAFTVSMVLPSNAMVLPKKKNYLRCYVWLYCPATISFVKCSTYVSFIAEQKKGKVVTYAY